MSVSANISFAKGTYVGDITTELKYEGILRDLIRQCQVIRKNEGFEITDRVNVSIKSNDEIKTNVIDKYKEEIESENSRIIFNNVRPTIGTNYSRSNNNSSMLNNLINLSDLSSKKINNTNILNNDKYIKNYLGQNESSYLQTEVNKENNSYIKGVIKKKKIVQNKKMNPFKKENDDYKKNKIESNCIKYVKKINNNKNKIINKTNITKEVANNKVSKKEIKTNNNINETKTLNNSKINTNKNIIKKINTNYKTENIFNKKDSEQNSNINSNKNKVNTRLLLNPKKIETKKTLTNKIIAKNDFNQNNIKTNNSFKKNKDQSKKNIILFDDNLENINFLDDEYPEPQNTNLTKNKINKEENKEGKNNEKNLGEIKKKNKQENVIVDFNNKQRKIEKNPVNNKINPSISNNKNKNINQNQSNRHAIKKSKKKKNKNIVFNIDLSNDNDNDFSKSEDISDNSISNEDKIMYARVDNLSQSYQHFINNYCNGNKNVILNQMKDYAKCFMQNFRIDQCNMSVPGTFGIERINIVIFGLKTTTLIPYILYISKNVYDQDELNKMFGILESYVMRRMIVHASTKNYNNLFTSLILNNVLDADALLSRIKKFDDSTTYVPSDNEIVAGFKTSKLINLQSKGIIYLIESRIRPSSSSTALLGFDNYSLEHLMPKKWRNNWELGESEEDSRNRDSALLTLGNLAIITQSLNASIRDASWDVKKVGKGDNKPGLDKCASGLITLFDALNKDEWNEAEIDKRADWLADNAIEIWKL